MDPADCVQNVETDKTPQQDARAPVGSTSSVAAPKTPAQGGRKTEYPSQPESIYTAFDILTEEEAIVGNSEMIFSMKQEGMLGVFYKRSNTTRTPTLVEIIPTNYRNAILNTLQTVVYRAFQLKKELSLVEINAAAQDLATQLANGIVVMTYMKLRAVNYLDNRIIERFYDVPKTPVPFEVLEPYALAISQLGQIKTSGTIVEGYWTPTVPATAVNFMLPVGINWNVTAYTRAVEYAKILGLRFASVDLDVKMGSSWWLYRPTQAGNYFCLECPVPEENFTVNTALLRTLFCNDGAGGYMTNIFNLAPLGASNFGSMLRNPPVSVDVLTYYAVEDTSENMYRLK